MEHNLEVLSRELKSTVNLMRSEEKKIHEFMTSHDVLKVEDCCI